MAKGRSGSRWKYVLCMTNQPCQCIEDGFCSRFQREMRGRFREICCGVNVDLGTSAAFREQWGREVEDKSSNATPTPLVIRTDQMPGDTVVMTAVVYSLHKAYPGKYITAVESPNPAGSGTQEIFAYNPHVIPKGFIPDASVVQMHYPAIHAVNQRGIHFMEACTEFLGMALGIPVPLMTNRPHLYFHDQEPETKDFWVICSGGKGDFTNKLWGQRNYQEVVDLLRGQVKFVQVGAGIDDHPRLRGVENMVGKTTLRELFDLVRRARGVLCGVSLLMHVAAALEKPAVIIAGGRESVQWNSYPKQQYVHTVGALPCRSVQGHVGHACWRSRVVAKGDGTWLDRNVCERPIDGLPQCMRMIAPVHVAELVARYNTVGEPLQGHG